MTSAVSRARAGVAAARGGSSPDAAWRQSYVDGWGGVGRAGRLLLTGVGLAGATGAMVLLGERLDLDNVLLLYLLVVVVIAIAVGRVAALVAAVVSYLLALYFFAPPRGEFHLYHQDQVVELAVFLVVALLVGLLADGAARRRQQLATERARVRRLAELERVRSGLLSAVSHDLRTPLAGIKANASALRYADETWSEDLRLELLTSIEESADQLSEMVANLLALGRIRAGGLRPDLRSVAVYEVVARSLTTLGDLAALSSGASASVSVDVAEDLPLVVADPSLLERVVANLVSNAIHHGGGAVTVRADEVVDDPVPDPAVADGAPSHGSARAGGPTGVRVSVIDHGPGIPEDRWGSAFEPFQRLTDSGAGMGLGLATARGFCDAMSVTLTPSHTPGGGLTISMALPVADGAA